MGCFACACVAPLLQMRPLHRRAAKLQVKSLIFVRENQAPLDRVYTLGYVIGRGSFGTVRGVTHKISGAKRVCKQILKSKAAGGMSMDEILSEIRAMAMIDHPNVLKVYEYFEDEYCVSQIMEPCDGGELQDRIFGDKRTPYGEEFMRDVMKQLLRALAFMHGERFIHKDLKPQNIMLCESESSSIKVIDFGLAELFDPNQKEHEMGGTLLYMAPEVFTLMFDMKVDIWSSGVILYNLITGDYPFMAPWPPPPGKDQSWWEAEVQRRISSERYRDHPKLSNGSVSANCLNLLDQMLNRDPRTRPSASESLQHPWFTDVAEVPPVLSVGVVQCLEAFAVQPDLKKAVFLLIAHECSPPAEIVVDLRRIFTHFDFDNHGCLANHHLREVLLKSQMTSKLVDQVVSAIDMDDSHSTQWSEFLAAALCVWICRQRSLIDAAFNRFDVNQDGLVSVEDLETMFAVGDVQGLWKARLPEEVKKIGGSSFSLEEFAHYVGERMKTHSGDAYRVVNG